MLSITNRQGLVFSNFEQKIMLAGLKCINVHVDSEQNGGNLLLTSTTGPKPWPM